MKRLGGIWEEMISIENLRLAYKKASRGRHHLAAIRRTEKHLDKLLQKLHDDLASHTFSTSEYRHKYIYEPKKRLISSLPFYPDRIVQHAVLNILEKYWDNRMIYDSYACRQNKGQHKGSNRCKIFVKHYKFACQCDISKFYDSIVHEIMKAILRRTIKDKDVLWLLDNIIDSMEFNLRGQAGVGLPIGSLLSQWFGNLYMNQLDIFIKQSIRCKAYVRYCDDFVLFSNDKKELHAWMKSVRAFVHQELRLTFSKCRIYPVSQGVDFLGYRHFSGYTLVRKSTVKRVKKRIRKIVALPENIDDKTLLHVQGQIASMKGWLEHADSHHLIQALHFSELWEKYHVGEPRRYQGHEEIQ